MESNTILLRLIHSVAPKLSCQWHATYAIADNQGSRKTIVQKITNSNSSATTRANTISLTPSHYASNNEMMTLNGKYLHICSKERQDLRREAVRPWHKE